QHGGDRRVRREAKRSLPGEVRRELVAERLHDRGAGGIEAAMVLERGVGHQEPTILFERRHRVADLLGRLGCGGSDRLSELLQRGALLIRKGGKVVLDAGRCGHPGLLVRGANEGFTLSRGCRSRKALRAGHPRGGRGGEAAAIPARTWAGSIRTSAARS